MLTISSGAIDGIVAGARVGIAALGVVSFLLYRRRIQGDAAISAVQEPELEIVDVKLPKYNIVVVAPQELPVGQYKIAELDGRTVDGRY